MLSVGAARVPLPMPIGLPLAGYLNRVGGATAIHDPLYARALVASDGLEMVCLLSVDILCVDAEFVAGVRDRIAAASAIRPETVMVAATHTHSAPAGIARFDLDRASALYLGTPNPALRSQAQAALVQAAVLALAHLAPVRLYSGSGHAEDVARNRIAANGPYDPEIPFVVAVNRDDEVVAAVFSLAIHSTVLGPGNLAYSGDLIGEVCHILEKRWGGSVVVGLAGAAGDISTRFTRREATFAEVQRLAISVADAIAAERKSLEIGYPVRAGRELVRLSLQPAESRDALQQRLTSAERRLADLATSPPAERRPVEAEIEGLQVALAADRQGPDHVWTEVQVLKLGRVLTVGYPGEMFVEFGQATRQALAPYHVLVAGYANDYIGYVPTPQAHRGYESTVALVAADSGEKLVELACRLAGGEVAART